MPHTVDNIACTVCGCVCDDLRVTVDEGRVTRAEGACFLAEPWFLAQGTRHPPAAQIDGRPVALDRAAAILRHSRSPLVYGLSRSSTEGQQAAVALADRIGAVIDTTASRGHAPAIMALQEAGDLFLPVEAGRDFEALWTLRGLVRGLAPEPGAVAGVPIDLLTALAERMKTCRFGVVFFGLGLSRGGPRTIEALLHLVIDLNNYTRFYARRMRVSGDVAGADSVLAWQTGYPFSVHLGRGYPRYNAGEFSGQNMLARGEVDACVLVGSQGVRRFTPEATAALNAIPTIVLDGPTVEPPVAAAVRFTTAVYGFHRPGVVYRMDEAPIPLRLATPSDYPSDAEVLQGIRKRLE